MSNDRRAPWWYSGEGDDQPEPGPGTDDLSAEAAVAPDAEADGTSAAMDWTALVAGAVKMVDWATEKVMAPHAEHVDPAEHPECMVCRTVTLIGDPVGLMGGGEPAAQEQSDRWGDATESAVEVPRPAASAGAQPIRWIPIVETGD